MGNITRQQIEYCVYARKSSESDERQAMSIDSQVKEMMTLAKKEGLQIKEIRNESCSAKTSGARSVFNQILADIREGKFNGILTWAPDRLSRNAGDLGMLVDLMDLGKLQVIRTYSQTFTNNPNEKFLLMILCSQAKLENDNRSINVKRGIRAKCEMGWRPGVAPLGYINRSFAGVKDIVIDPERAPAIKEIFDLVGNCGYSGRTVKKWFDKDGLRTRQGKKVALSQIYLILKNPFYYGEFKYPVNSEHWYKGAHEPLISKELFDKAQKQLEVPRKAKWRSKVFDFRGPLKCGNCGALITAEERFRKLKNGSRRRHLYYHCTKKVDPDCKNLYATENDVIKGLMRFFNETEPSKFKITEKLKGSILMYEELKGEILEDYQVNSNEKPLNLAAYAKHVLKKGNRKEKQELLTNINLPLYLQNRNIITKP